MKGQPLLSVKDLEISYGNFKAVDNVSFDLYHGETLALVGESGSGKSTVAQGLLKLLMGRTKISGSAFFENIDLLDPSIALHSIRGSKIGMIFQDPLSSLNPTMKIGKQIQEALKDKNKSEVLALLEQVGIPDPVHRFNQYPHELSGGMRQRVLIAIAIASKPSILIADEPTTALDATIQRQILELLHSLQKDLKMSMLLITHDLGIVAGYADRVMVMKNGKIVESAGVDQLFYHAKSPYTQLLLNSSTRFL